MSEPAAAASLEEAANRAVRDCPAVLSVHCFHRILEPLHSGDPTEVLFLGRISGMRRREPLTAWLEDDPPDGFRNVRVEAGW